MERFRSGDKVWVYRDAWLSEGVVLSSQEDFGVETCNVIVADSTGYKKQTFAIGYHVYKNPEDSEKLVTAIECDIKHLNSCIEIVRSA